MSTLPDINTLVIQSAQLLTNYSAIWRSYYDIFINPTPLDISLEVYDDNNNIQTVTLPNRAKDFRYILNGNSTPQGSVAANIGSIYQDILNGDIYLKISGVGNTGWTKIITKNILDSYLLQGNGSPEGVILAPKGILYIDLAEPGLYIKTTSTGNTGWNQISGGTQGPVNADTLDNLDSTDFWKKTENVAADTLDGKHASDFWQKTDTLPTFSATDLKLVYDPTITISNGVVQQAANSGIVIAIAGGPPSWDLDGYADSNINPTTLINRITYSLGFTDIQTHNIVFPVNEDQYFKVATGAGFFSAKFYKWSS
jgi:hypothetical protein